MIMQRQAKTDMCIYKKEVKMSLFIHTVLHHENRSILTLLSPLLYSKTMFKGVYITFLISAHAIDCGYPLEALRRGGSIEYQQSMF